LDRVGIVAAGHAGYTPTSPGRSYKELVFEAARLAYGAAGVDPRRDIDSFVCTSEDYLEGTSIFDAYVPDQLGAALRPVQTIAGDGLMGIATAVMLIRSGVATVVAVAAHAKSSDVVSAPDIVAFALDPVFERPLGVHPWFVAGLEMERYLAGSARTARACAEVVARNRTAALANPSAARAAALTVEDVLASPLVCDPLRELDCPLLADGAVVVVLATEGRARQLCGRPVWVDGIGWSTESASLGSRTWGTAEYARHAADRAYRQAGITGPEEEIDVAEVDDTFSYKQLQHLDALGLAGLAPSRVNPTGGTLGRGYLFEANGLARVADVVAQLRGEAAACQVEGARVGVVQSWRGVPTTTGAVAVLSVDRPGS
jgi:acetyl-CoA C-acetyltransferase